MADPYGPLFMLFRSQKIKQQKLRRLYCLPFFWRHNRDVTSDTSWFNDFISRLSSETKPRPKSWPTLSIVWSRLKESSHVEFLGPCQHSRLRWCRNTGSDADDMLAANFIFWWWWWIDDDQSFEDAIEMALDKPLWGLLAASRATHWWCMPNDDDDDDVSLYWYDWWTHRC